LIPRKHGVSYKSPAQPDLNFCRTIEQIKNPRPKPGVLFSEKALPLLAALLAALSGLLARLLGLLTGLLLAALLAALSGLLARLLGLLAALIWIILAHSYSNFLSEVLLECRHSNNSVQVSYIATKARDLEKET
jgi:hypothetical protein